MLRRPAPPAPRRRPVQEDVRAGVALVLLLVAPLGGPVAAPVPGYRDLVGQILYVLNPTTVRTRGGGNLSVDLPRGQSVVLLNLSGDRAILAPGPSDTGLLRAYGVRKTPRYTATPAQLAADFVPGPAWEKAREEGARRLLDRWPGLSPDQAAKIFLGEAFVGMTQAQAEVAVGRVVLARDPVSDDNGTVAWKIGRRPRSAELGLYNEARERGALARTFEEFIATRTRAVLTFRGGVVAAIDPPEGQTPGLNWP